MSDRLQGSNIIELFNAHFNIETSIEDVPVLDEILTPKERAEYKKHQKLIEGVRQLYKTAERCVSDNPDKAIELCESALDKLEATSSRIFGDLATPYLRGKCHLLLASIYLNEDRDLEQAEEHYLQSRDAFASRKWLSLEGLAYLGLAITWQKSKRFEEALDVCEKAQFSIQQEVMPENVGIQMLWQAIQSEEQAIKTDREAFEASKEKITLPLSGVKEKKLPLFKMSAGRGLITSRTTTDPNLLSRQDYERKISEPEEVVIDLTKRQHVQYADYLLEVDEFIDKIDDGLNKGDWLVVRAETNPNRLNQSQVAVLTKNNGEMGVSLKTFVKVRDHYFLEAQDDNTASIAVVDYDGDIEKIRSYYKKFHRPVEIKLAYDVQISGKVIDHIPQEALKEATIGYLWQIPVVNDIAAGLGVITEEKVAEYLYLKKDKSQGADFGVRVIGDSMKGHGILSGDIALIHRQPDIKVGEIAAIVILTPETKVGVLKQYYVYDKQENILHWFLRSNNPGSEHLVVMPPDVDEKAIEDLYAKKVRAGQMIPPKYYKDAEIAIAGKYVGLVREA